MRRWIIVVELLLIVIGIVLLVRAYYSPVLLTIHDPAATSTVADAGGRQVLIYFTNTKMDPLVSCTRVFPVSRTVQDSPSAMQATIEELLKGPNAAEKEEGYSSLIDPATRIQSLIADRGDVALDLSSEFTSSSGGSCRVSAIRAEITETLKQFPGIQNIMITSNGRADVLEP